MKKLNKMKFRPLILLLSWAISACIPKPPDIFVFENLAQHLATDPVTTHLVLTPSPTCMKQIGEMECGHGVAIVSGKEVYIGDGPTHLFSGKSWTQVKLESIYLPAVESFGPLSEYIINACKKMNCNKQVDAFKVKTDSLKDVNAAIKNH